MSTGSSDEFGPSEEWVSQAEAARIKGVSRQAIHKLVRNGRLRSLRIGGHVLVHRFDLEAFQTQPGGRPSVADMGEFERIKAIVDGCGERTKVQLARYLAPWLPRELQHPVEKRLGTTSGVILDALERAGELTVRMFRGVIAEAAFETYILNPNIGWKSEPIPGNSAFDFLIGDPIGQVRIQVKLQRSEKGLPRTTRTGYYVVETQRTRGGVDVKTGEPTRPYRYGEFDILAVCLQPSEARWDAYRYTVADWLQPSPRDARSIATLQPVARERNEDWAEDLDECVRWFRSGRKKRISGEIRKGKAK